MKKKITACVVTLTALWAGYFFFYAKKDQISSTIKPTSAVKTEPANTQKPTGTSDPFQLIRDGKTVVQALDEAIALRGKADPKVYSLFKSAWLLCKGEYDPKGVLSSKNPDPTRLWAIDRLSKTCEGFNPSMYKFERKDMFDSSLYRKDPEQAISLANQHIRSSVEQQEIYESGVMLLESGKFPLESALPSYRDYGTSDLIMPWVRATSMLSCSESGGCDAYALQTLSYCANHGCSVNSDLNTAYQRNLNPREYNATVAFHRWLQARRK
jgi:hypothetical protein